jgi:hypothetical protein
MFWIGFGVGCVVGAGVLFGLFRLVVSQWSP